MEHSVYQFFTIQAEKCIRKFNKRKIIPAYPLDTILEQNSPHPSRPNRMTKRCAHPVAVRGSWRQIYWIHQSIPFRCIPAKYASDKNVQLIPRYDEGLDGERHISKRGRHAVRLATTHMFGSPRLWNMTNCLWHNSNWTLRLSTTRPNRY